MSGRSLRSSPGSCSTVVRRTQRRSPDPVPEIPSNPDDYIESEEQDAAGEEALREAEAQDRELLAASRSALVMSRGGSPIDDEEPSDTDPDLGCRHVEGESNYPLTSANSYRDRFSDLQARVATLEEQLKIAGQYAETKEREKAALAADRDMWKDDCIKARKTAGKTQKELVEVMAHNTAGDKALKELMAKQTEAKAESERTKEALQSEVKRLRARKRELEQEVAKHGGSTYVPAPAVPVAPPPQWPPPQWKPPPQPWTYNDWEDDGPSDADFLNHQFP